MQPTKPSNQTYTLAIECSNPDPRGDNRGEVALAITKPNAPPQFIASQTLSKDAKGTDALMSAIDTLCKQHAVTPSKIDSIVISTGPGGYTALRVSITIAKVLATTLNCKVIPVPTAVVAAIALNDTPNNTPKQPLHAIIALASKKDKAHCTQLKDNTLTPLGISTADDIINSGAQLLVADHHLPDTFAKAANSASIKIIPITLTAQALLEASTNYPPINPQDLAPIYAREPDAVTQWRARALAR